MTGLVLAALVAALVVGGVVGLAWPKLAETLTDVARDSYRCDDVLVSDGERIRCDRITGHTGPHLGDLPTYDPRGWSEIS